MRAIIRASDFYTLGSDISPLRKINYWLLLNNVTREWLKDSSNRNEITVD